MVHHHNPDSYERAVKAVLTLQVRTITMGNAQANKFQINWLEWAKDVREDGLAKAFQEIKNEIENNHGSDEDFKANFYQNGGIYDSGAARHMLRRLDLAAAAVSGTRPDDVDVEHILPKSLPDKLNKKKPLNASNKTWILDLGESEIPETDEAKQQLGAKLTLYVHKIGNQALLHQTENRAKGDQTFAKKQAGYQEMNFKLSREVGECASWTLSEICGRQERLADLAVTAWSTENIHV